MTNTNTRFCPSLLINNFCDFSSENCKFAHSMSDLEPKKCRYGKKCNLVFSCSLSGYLSNHLHRKKCEFIHPKETFENYCYRLTISNFFQKKKSRKRLQQIVDRIEYIEEIIESIKNTKTEEYNRLH